MPATLLPAYLRPKSTIEALSALDRKPMRILAGGTDYFPSKVGQAVDEELLDITAIPELRGITEEESFFRIGATTTWSEIVRAPLPEWMRALQWAAQEVGGPQVQNSATLGGNLCNASPAADGIPALMALNAEVELRSIRGTRRMPLPHFLVGNRRHCLAPDELLSAVFLPKPQLAARSTFIKLGSRRYLVISIAMVAACVHLDPEGRVLAAGIAVGACSEVAQRLTELERHLIDAPVAQAWQRVRDSHLAALSPLSDVRGEEAYRRAMAVSLVRDALRELQ